MKSEKELLQIVLENLPILRDDTIIGICDVVDDLHNTEDITDNELDVLNNILNNHLPKAKYKHGYCWKADDLQSRVDWLEKLIKAGE